MFKVASRFDRLERLFARLDRLIDIRYDGLSKEIKKVSAMQNDALRSLRQASEIKAQKDIRHI